MNHFIPTYEQALEMVNSRGELVFYETKTIVDGFNISIFNYRLTTYNDFINPVDGKDYNAREMRGICFVFNSDGTLFNRYIMLHKFWNINQVPETQLNILKEKNIDAIYNKEDGSLISFIMLPNGKIVAKTKAGFDNDQSIKANEIFNNDTDLSDFVRECLKNDMIPYFEYVSFKNKIVLHYDKTSLILLKVRNNITGEYLDIEFFRDLINIDIVRSEEIITWDELMLCSETEKGREGWVILAEGDMYKLKTLEYWNLHNLITEELNREDNIIEMILNNTIDDAISQLNQDNDKERIDWIKEIECKVKQFISDKIIEVDELVKEYNGDMKSFAIKNHKLPNFSLAVEFIKGKEKYDVMKDLILKKTYRLESAREFLRTNKL